MKSLMKFGCMKENIFYVSGFIRMYHAFARFPIKLPHLPKVQLLQSLIHDPKEAILSIQTSSMVT
jgi:hypothetical protein